MQKRKEQWAVGLTAADYKLAKRHRLWKRDGSPFWWTRVDGKKTSLVTEVLADAVAAVDKRRHDNWKEKEMGVARKYSWADACKRREADSSKSMKSWKLEEQRLRWWWPHLCKIKDLNQISTDQIADIIESGKLVNPDPSLQRNGDGVVRVDHSGPASCNTTANKYVRTVQTVLNQAASVWGWKNNPPLLKRYKEGLPRDEAPTPYDMLKFVELLPAHSRDILIYGLMTAHRRANITGLRWDMISWEKRAVKVAGALTKTGAPIYVPLNDVVMELLERRRSAPDRHPVYVFTFRGERVFAVVTAAFDRAREQAGMPNVCAHTTRHCWQTWMAEEGVPMEMRARLGGWKVAGMGAMDDYVHLNIEPLRQYAAIPSNKWKAAVQMRVIELQAQKGERAAALLSIWKPTDAVPKVSQRSGHTVPWNRVNA